MPLYRALTEGFNTDACFAPYSVPSLPYRLTSEALEDVDVPMKVVAFDIDDHDAHREDRPSTDTWHRRTLRKVEHLACEHPRPFAHSTPRGVRVLYRLPPLVVRDQRDATAWKCFYDALVADLLKFDLVADRQCGNFTRLFRVPCGTRPGKSQPEAPETYGDPARIGIWRTELRLSDFFVAPRRSPSPCRREGGAVRCLSRYVSGALRSSSYRVATSVTDRNATLNRETFTLASRFVGNGLEEGELVAAMTTAGVMSGLPSAEIAATIRSALSAAKRRGR
jgi:hypothetical protein